MRSRDTILNVWFQLLLGVAFLALSLALPSIWPQPPSWLAPLSALAGVALFIIAGYLGFVAGRPTVGVTEGGAGGAAKVSGSESQAYGGKGGAGGTGRGGAGGRAEVTGNRSTAVGGGGGASAPLVAPHE